MDAALADVIITGRFLRRPVRAAAVAAVAIASECLVCGDDSAGLDGWASWRFGRRADDGVEATTRLRRRRIWTEG